jgi:dimethylargininase
MRPLALVRPPSDDFVSAVTDDAVDPPLDPDLARRQHAAYVAALEAGGFTVRSIGHGSGYPDACFVEDTAIVMEGRALVTRPGHPTRRGEVHAVAEALADLVAVERTEAPATIDGGDVLQVGGVIFVGRSERTNDAGIERLTRFAAGRAVIPVEVGGVLHLKSAVTAIDDRTVLVFPRVIDETAFSGLAAISVPGHDPEVANVVRLPDGRVLVGSDASAALVSDAGFEVVAVDVSEFGRAGGGLTCLSLRLRDVYAAEIP